MMDEGFDNSSDISEEVESKSIEDMSFGSPNIDFSESFDDGADSDDISVEDYLESTEILSDLSPSLYDGTSAESPEDIPEDISEAIEEPDLMNFDTGDNGEIPESIPEDISESVGETELLNLNVDENGEKPNVISEDLPKSEEMLLVLESEKIPTELEEDIPQITDNLKPPAEIQHDLFLEGTKQVDTEELGNWLKDINPNYDPLDIESPFCNNCGSCAFAVEQHLSGNTDITATSENIGTAEEMNALTGMEQVPMEPEEIQQYLLAQGPGAHAIIGIDRTVGPGHWFNAVCLDDHTVVAIDGQSGEILDWPPDYGDVSHWDISMKKEAL